MSAISRFAAIGLFVLASALVIDAAQATPVSGVQAQVALNPQPLPPGDEIDPWGFDFG